MKKQRENFYRYFKLLRNALCAFQIYAYVSFQNTKETVKMLFGVKDLDIDKDVVKRAVTIIKGKWYG